MYIKGTSLWDKEDIKYIIDFYSISTVKDLAYALDKTKNQVTSKVLLLQKQGKLARKFSKEVHIWTEAEEQFLVANYGKMSKAELAAHLKVDTLQVNQKATYMRRKGYNVPITVNAPETWTPDKLEYLKSHYPTHTQTELAKALGMKESTVKGKIQKMLTRGELIRKGKGRWFKRGEDIK